jgi:hypothetical protein
MTASTALAPSVRAAFTALVDYAGLFPPAELRFEEARREYASARSGAHAWMLGRFILPASLASATVDAPLSVIVAPQVDAVNDLAIRGTEGARVEALEIPIGGALSPLRHRLSADEVLDLIGALEADLATAGLRGIPTFVELPWNAPWNEARGSLFDALARFNLGAKMRCGGATSQAFPSVAEVAEFIATAAAARVPFKATAGLHHPIRHRDAASGFTMHGFLNLIAAAALAPSVERDLLEAIVADEDPQAFAFAGDAFIWRDRRIGVERLVQTRRDAFVGYGSCSFAEPVDDLTALGVFSTR